ncbi:hypothetical protein CFC21_004224 [Triticum aestivum]|uniref:Uncharacterized protein n=1 Tax=Triticum aestivum TaxID=4565 RepID=A0A3B5Y6K0_WHEAT|nr:hypothetical protein CFC21_004224 [Triticum aestivum]
MRREGRQRGWVRVYDRSLVDPEGKRRAVHAVDVPVVANGGFIRAPRKPTNQSKSGGLRALGRDALARGGGAGAAAPSAAGRRVLRVLLHDDVPVAVQVRGRAVSMGVRCLRARGGAGSSSAAAAGAVRGKSGVQGEPQVQAQRDQDVLPRRGRGCRRAPRLSL